ncbi:MAG: O-antigen ligase family protein [Bacteroidota bacterium]
MHVRSSPRPRWLPRAASLVVGIVAVVLVVTLARAFELDRFFVPKELVLHVTAAMSALLVLGAVRRFQVTWADLALGAFLMASAASALLATNAWAGTRVLALTVSGVLLFWVGRVLADEGLGRVVLRAAGVGVVLAAVLALLQAYGVESAFFATNRSPGGTLGNRNFVGHLAAFGLPLLLRPVVVAERWRSALVSLAGVALVVGILVLTRSRAAWLGAAGVMAVMTLGLLLAPALRRPATLGRMVVVLVLAVGSAVAVTVLPNALDWRSDTPYLETAQGVLNYQDGSGRGRLLQYQRSLTLVRDAPVLGVGPGNWSVAYPGVAPPGDPSMSGSRAGMTSNPWPSSDAVALVAERGVLGTVLWLLFAAVVLEATWRALRRATDPGDAMAAVVLLAVGAGVVITGAFDAVLLLAWPVLIVAVVAGVLFPADQARAVSMPGWVPVLACAVLVALSAAGAVRSAGQWAAMDRYQADAGRDSLERAAQLDPGNVRIHLRLAQRSRGAARCPHAQAAVALYPHAAEAQRLAARCR